jgi:hypothetical protein
LDLNARSRLFAVACAIVGFCFLLSGCGKPGPKRYHLAGKVTWGGKPIPAGIMYFDPDLASDVDGPQGFASIQNGQYDTRLDGQGHGGGKSVVRIHGADGVPTGEAAMGKSLFPEYSITIELPATDSTKDFNVPRR